MVLQKEFLVFVVRSYWITALLMTLLSLFVPCLSHATRHGKTLYLASSIEHRRECRLCRCPWLYVSKTRFQDFYLTGIIVTTFLILTTFFHDAPQSTRLLSLFLLHVVRRYVEEGYVYPPLRCLSPNTGIICNDSKMHILAYLFGLRYVGEMYISDYDLMSVVFGRLQLLCFRSFVAAHGHSSAFSTRLGVHPIALGRVTLVCGSNVFSGKRKLLYMGFCVRRVT